ncbi:hypothetical protein PFICI_11832 [Pestalotiopsis fici W106-1]|uniref:Uncharacterized protein n=1 Tax=Pestalotiopsis fici (strain W106-1 / CGMCC3.15140) TaxID=1229662 RepID=W3WRF1_PESFW|nr:uncharacterized protein PFICI_11832 [Pestalotiopsis fici W106-1]ETS76445.1 hypothetical protein PFICI_11832 [Pestalotiopsis fici W106-1]
MGEAYLEIGLEVTHECIKLSARQELAIPTCNADGGNVCSWTVNGIDLLVKIPQNRLETLGQGSCDPKDCCLNKVPGLFLVLFFFSAALFGLGDYFDILNNICKAAPFSPSEGDGDGVDVTSVADVAGLELDGIDVPSVADVVG